MGEGERRTWFPVSLYSTPSTLYRELFYTVLRAGHLCAAPGYGVKRDHFPGHELILALSGRSVAVVAGVTHDIRPGDFVWLNCHHPHEHRADDQDPWDAYWVRVEGPHLDRIGAMLGIQESPVIRGLDRAQAEQIFESVFDHMRQDKPESAPLIHAQLAKLVALACCTRKLPVFEVSAPDPLRKALQRMRREYYLPFRVADLAAEAGMSPSHFARSFRKTFSTGPIDWLRRERINQAKRRLKETSDPVQWIAEQVGYRDRFFFSKDFKRMTGMTAREFRRREFGVEQDG